MNKKLIPIIVILLVAVAGVFFFISKGKTKLGSTVVTKSSSPKTLKEIFGLGVAQKCTYPGGTIYVSNGKMRGDFASASSGETMSGHMIVDGNTSYVWTDGSKTGLKTTFDVNSDASSGDSASEQGSEGINPAKPEDYVCEAWITNGEVFTLPSGVTFTDVNSLIPSGVPTTSTSTVSNQCSYCDALSGEQKTECLSAMNCE